MKLIHLSDLHIGKRVNEFSMLEDQRYILDQITSIIEKEAPDAVLICGDIYDKPVPPSDAVRVLDGFLTSLAQKKVPVFLISGNHDSAERLAFGSQLMMESQVIFSPVYDGEPVKYCMKDEYGEVWIHLLPFLKPAVVRHVFPEEEITSYQDAVSCAVKHMQIDPTKRNVLLAHQFVTGAARCDSEEVSVGGVDQIAAETFQEFDYTALGHIHSPQNFKNGKMRYCGTPLKYSFSECGQKKSVTVVELKEKGTTEIREIGLLPLRDLRSIRGSYLEVSSREFYEDTNTEDYVRMILMDEEDVVDGMQKLRTIYPNLMQLEYDNQRTREAKEITEAQVAEEKSELEYFEEFFELQNNHPMLQEQREFVSGLIGKLKENEL